MGNSTAKGERDVESGGGEVGVKESSERQRNRSLCQSEQIKYKKQIKVKETNSVYCDASTLD